MKTNVYHITYTPATKSASLRFWGCNMSCVGCLCQEGLYDHLLKENRLGDGSNLTKPAKPDLLGFDEVIERLSGLELERIFLTGEEASIDPAYAALTGAFHDSFGSENVLYTNGYETPPVADTDAVEIGIKAISDELHLRYTGRPVQPVLENFTKYAEMGMKMTAATILIPGLVEAAEIEKIARFIASVDENIPYFVLPYFPAGANPWRKTRPEEVEAVVSLVKKHLPNVFGCEGTEREILYEVERVF